MSELKINLGAGSNRIPNWLNFDTDVDITKPLPWPENSVDMFLAEHVTEHQSQAQCLDFFKNCHWCLKPGGVLRVCTPVLRNIIRNKNDIRQQRSAEDYAARRAHAEDLIRGHGHKWIAFNEGIFAMLWIAGFENILETERKPCDGHHAVIGIEKDDLESIRIEATK